MACGARGRHDRVDSTGPFGAPASRAGCDNVRVPEWIVFIHPPRDNFADTMTAEEESVWAVHFEKYQEMLAEGRLILAGPTLGPKNTGIFIFEAADEQSARSIMENDPVIAGGYATGELRPFRVSLMRGGE